MLTLTERYLSFEDKDASFAFKSNSGSNIADGELKAHFIDVGQADCILFQADDQSLLIDAGNNEDADTIVTYLREQGINKLDYVIGTHPHEDHIGSLDTVIHNFDIGVVLMPNKVHTSKTFEDVLDAIEEKNLSITEPVVGDEYQLGEAVFTIVAPNRDYEDDLNNWSIGIKVAYRNNIFLLCGDIEKEAELDIIKNGIHIAADVLKVSHHGSKTSTSAEFLKAVNPAYAVISVGKDNSYDHPSDQTLQRLNENGVEIFRTDELGTIIAISDGTTITWKWSKDETDN